MGRLHTLPCLSSFGKWRSFGHLSPVVCSDLTLPTDLGIIIVITHRPVYLKCPFLAILSFGVPGVTQPAQRMELRMWQRCNAGCHSNRGVTSPYIRHTFWRFTARFI